MTKHRGSLGFTILTNGLLWISPSNGRIYAYEIPTIWMTQPPTNLVGFSACFRGFRFAGSQKPRISMRKATKNTPSGGFPHHSIETCQQRGRPQGRHLTPLPAAASHAHGADAAVHAGAAWMILISTWRKHHRSILETQFYPLVMSK